MITSKEQYRLRRRRRIRAKVYGTPERPRIAVFKSNKSIYAQLIDDSKAVTIAHVSSLKMKGKSDVERSFLAGVELAKKAKSKKIDQVVFDRGGYNFIGRVKALADGAREGGLEF